MAKTTKRRFTDEFKRDDRHCLARPYERPRGVTSRSFDFFLIGYKHHRHLFVGLGLAGGAMDPETGSG